MRKGGLILAIFFSLLPLGLKAQFYTTGDEPAGVRWSRQETDSYRLIYPRGLDSLANVYASLLEQYKAQVSRSTGLDASRLINRKLPVILHTLSGTSNGTVVWAPRRMELYTLPEPYNPEALSWEKNLAVHESRHVSQMMLGYKGALRPFHWFFGDLIPAAASAVYPNTVLLEGDAVVAETALTNAGRGRDGDFLNYYMSAFDSGDFRNWYAWRYGSWRHYAPDYYALGYMTVAGTRVFYDDPLFMDNYFSAISRNPLRLGNMRKEMQRASGKDFSQAWDGIVEGFRKEWATNAEARAPYTPSTPVTSTPTWYESYNGGTFVGDNLFVLNSGLLKATSLVEIDPSGNKTVLRPFASESSKLSYDPARGRIYWSETLTDPRWNMAASSVIKYLYISDGKYMVGTLTKRGRKFYNPSPSEDGSRLAVVEYPSQGGTILVILDSEDGSELSRFRAPDGLQLVEPVWVDGKIVVSGVSSKGMGIYLYDGQLSTILEPVPAKISGLRADGSSVLFASDRTGVNEIYRLEGDNVLQLTSTRYGAKDPVMHGDTLYFTTLRAGIPIDGSKRTGEGRLLYKAAASDLSARKVDFGEVYRDPVAEELSRQEKVLADSMVGIPSQDRNNGVEAGHDGRQVRNYSKAANLFRFHSWAPVSLKYDSFSVNNFDDQDYTASIGATALFQNDLGTASGYISYGYDPDSSVDKYRHSLHFNMTYSGLYPVIQIKADVGDGSALRYRRVTILRDDSHLEGLSFSYRSKPKVEAQAKVYIPWRFNSNGWLRGLTPAITYKFSNARYIKATSIYTTSTREDGSTGYDLVSTVPGSTVFMQTLETSLTGYIMRPTAPSARYPRLGIGAQLGYRTRIALDDLYTAGMFGYLYSYLPGFSQSQGIRLTALLHHRFDAMFGENTVDSYPRGFDDSSMDVFLARYSRTQLNLTADYAIQVGLGEKHILSPLAHPTHLSIIPHADFSLLSLDALGKEDLSAGNVYSLGANVLLGLANFLWIPYATEIGISVNYNGGKTMNLLDQLGYAPSDVSASFLFNISF